MAAKKPRIFVDWNNWGVDGVRMNCRGTFDEVARENLELRDGLPLILYGDDLEGDAIVRWSNAERIWVAEVDKSRLRRVTS
jgi:hypothetical protein